MPVSGQRSDIDLIQSIEVQEIHKSVRKFGQPSPHIANTGIERNGGITNIYEQETTYPETGYHFVTESGVVLSAEDNPGTDYKVIRADQRAIGQVSKYGVESRVSLDGYDDAAIASSDDIIAIRINLTDVTIYNLSLSGDVIASRVVSFSGLAGLSPYFSSLSIVRYKSMAYADSQEFALRMADNLVILKESTPSQFVPIGIGGSTQSVFPSGGNLTAIGTYRNFLVFGSNNGKVASFDGQSFKYSDGTGTGQGPFNNATAVGAASIVDIREYHPTTDEYYLCIASTTLVASWDGIAWKNFDGTGVGNGPFNNATAIAANINATTTYLDRYFVVFGASGRVASWDGVGTRGFKNYNGTGVPHSGPFDNGTVIGANTIQCAEQFGTRLAVAGVGGRLGSWLSGAWTIYTAGTGLSNNATVIGANNISDLLNYNGTYLIVAGDGGRIGSWDGTNFKNYDGTGTGTGPSNNATTVGAFNISTLTQIQNTVVIIGVGAGIRIGSWNGTNFKNYDGTGTGTGPFSSGVVYFNGVTRAVLYQVGSFSAVVFSGTTYSYVTVNNQYGILYNSSSGQRSRILTASSLNGYLYTYRYENGLYLTQITGNDTNKTFLFDQTVSGPQFYTFNGRYLLPQVSGGLTRHVLIETPRIDTVPAVDTLRALSLTGYVDFVTFSTSQVYPDNDTVNVNAINIDGVGPVVGFGYADVTYRTTASVTDIQELYLPPPSPYPASFNRIVQSNTPTNVNGYSKLNNMLGCLTSKPFEFRGIFINGQQSALSVAMIDGIATDALGVLITNVGEWDDSYTPMIVDDDKILYRFANKLIVVKIGSSIPEFFDKISTNLYKINTIHPSNIYSDSDKTLYQSSMDYHGQAFFTSTSAPVAGASLIANRIDNTYSNSIDVGEKVLSISNPAQANIEVFGARLPSQYGVTPPYYVDTYIGSSGQASEYAFSTLSDGTEVVVTSKTGVLYISTAAIPPAIGGQYYLTTVVINNTTSFLIKTFAQPEYDAYLIGNDLPSLYIGFQLYGTDYIFDGKYIYQITMQDGFVQSRDIIAPADGLQYIASTPNLIYFLSSFDNSIYTFSGGRSLDKGLRFTNTASILKGVWSVHDNSLLLDTADALIWVRDGIITANPKKANQTDLKLYETTGGVVISNDVSKWRYTYAPLVGSVVVPLRLKTSFYGLGSDIGSILKSVVITVYSEAQAPFTLRYTIYTYDQDADYQDSDSISVAASQYNGEGFARVRITPKHAKSIGASLDITINEYVLVDNIVALYDGVSGAVISKELTV